VTASGLPSERFTGRLHVAGSADPASDPDLLAHAHAAVEATVRTLVRQGGSVAVSVVSEPRWGPNADGLPLVFDWTVLDAVDAALRAGDSEPRTSRGPLAIAVCSESALNSLPSARTGLWKRLLESGAIDVRQLTPGWTAGGHLRIETARYGDVLVTIAGGQGVEHLATEYRRRNRPVIPLDYPLGSSTNGKAGGGVRLARMAASDPARFFELRSETPSTSSLLLLAHSAHKDPADLADRLVGLLDHLTRPSAFFVRLLDAADPDYPEVDEHFREVIAPVVTGLGYQTVQMGSIPMRSALIDVEIFSRLGSADVAVVDLNGLRPNCFLELGFVLGRAAPTIVTARNGTSLPFDAHAVPCCFWNPTGDPGARAADLQQFWRNNIARAHLGPDLPQLW